MAAKDGKVEKGEMRRKERKKVRHAECLDNPLSILSMGLKTCVLSHANRVFFSDEHDLEVSFDPSEDPVSMVYIGE